MRTKYFFTAIALVLFFSVSTFAQKEMKEIKVPKNVSEAFTKLYPKATDVKWEKEGDEEFEIVFKDNGASISVVLDDDGKLMETETVVQASELPKTVAPYIEKKYAGYTISKVEKIVDSKGNATFEVGISKDKMKKELIFDSNGKHVKKEKKSEKNEKDEKEEHEKD
jgi:hypothetical protein